MPKTTAPLGGYPGGLRTTYAEPFATTTGRPSAIRSRTWRRSSGGYLFGMPTSPSGLWHASPTRSLRKTRRASKSPSNPGRFSVPAVAYPVRRDACACRAATRGLGKETLISTVDERDCSLPERSLRHRESAGSGRRTPTSHDAFEAGSNNHGLLLSMPISHRDRSGIDADPRVGLRDLHAEACDRSLLGVRNCSGRNAISAGGVIDPGDHL